MHGENMNEYRALVGKPEENRPLCGRIILKLFLEK
jgi:hypothetical protein